MAYRIQVSTFSLLFCSFLTLQGMEKYSINTPVHYNYDQQELLMSVDKISREKEVVTHLTNQIKLCIFAAERISFVEIYDDSTCTELVKRYESKFSPTDDPQLIWLNYFVARAKHLSTPENLQKLGKNIPKMFNDIHLFLQDLTSVDYISPFKEIISNQNFNIDVEALYEKLPTQKQVLAAHYKALAPIIWSAKKYNHIPRKRAPDILEIYAFYASQGENEGGDSPVTAPRSYTTRSEFNVYDIITCSISPFNKKFGVFINNLNT